MKQRIETHFLKLWRPTGGFAFTAAIMFTFVGCNGLPSSVPSVQTGQQTYMAPVVTGSSVTNNMAEYSISDTLKTYSQTTPAVPPGVAPATTGTFTILPRGLLSLSTSSSTYGPAIAGGYAIELANQAGALLQLQGQPITPLAATLNCPNLATAQTFQFITIPQPYTPGNLDHGWNPATDTAFGSATISTTGSTVSFSNIQQFTLPNNGGAPGMPAAPFVASATGLCSSGPFGNTVSTPPTVTITNPGGLPGTQDQTPSTTLGIGSTGFLVASNSFVANFSRDNLLGGGNGVVGVPRPLSSLGSSPISSQGQQGPQYLGFIYTVGGSSEPISLGFVSQPSTCSSVTTQTSTLIYGGDFRNGDPASSPDGYSLCNFALDLGVESSSSNGLYLNAKVWLGASFDGAATTSSDSAVAVVGQLQGKFVVLVITENSAFYLMQSN